MGFNGDPQRFAAALLKQKSGLSGRCAYYCDPQRFAAALLKRRRELLGLLCGLPVIRSDSLRPY